LNSSLSISPLDNPIRKAMQEFHEIEQRKQCDVLLNILLGGQLAQNWWDRPNRAFSNQCPIDVFKINPRSVLDYLRSHCSGDYY
jgi:hypothetical protein